MKTPTCKANRKHDWIDADFNHNGKAIRQYCAECGQVRKRPYSFSEWHYEPESQTLVQLASEGKL